MTAGEDPVSNRTDMECLNIGEQDTESSEQEDSRRESIPLIFDHSYTERQSHLHRETKWLGDKARELHRKLAVLKRVQKDIEERTRILREKNLELLERNQQLSAGNRQLRDELVEVSAVRREREEYLRLAIIHQEFTWEDNAKDQYSDRHGDKEP
ncbi:uncharacterized protein LOC111252595 isoform X2 [Varroa destructor]|nr:uncharacterized protein LOC111252595 isoform X2 [Varroa destructor]XP_022666529.1 uncharacterized protein LOC111252595 isoform X2 [Varroa destructor]XP_022666538.1 uncharacterized protein LOC111252595 isoform X2 [Varroa destructor]XP_022666545.1 uncharacterized protein LOC111252595 isoform X2 [Varroa destructor]XP_022666553.1 uncharacterized protein LOC111252595 isoform X2 [Varroa destructor]XP_022666560.1 uncharacterized protein LOC111252595 isoform X2 [Varroa destructor]XP_022666570.1 un